jgi:hypothetical protein
MQHPTGSDNFQAYSAESPVIYGFRPGDTPDNPTYATYIDLDPTQYVLATPNFTGVDILMFAGAADLRWTQIRSSAWTDCPG